VPDCIANEDGERQIATALSFHGEEMVSSPLYVIFENSSKASVHRQSSQATACEELQEHNSWFQELARQDVCAALA
jgi:hypothetical protein